MTSDERDERLRRMSPTARATYDRFRALREEIGPIDFDVVKALREIRDDEEGGRMSLSDRSLEDLLAEIICMYSQKEWDRLPPELRRRVDNYVHGPDVRDESPFVPPPGAVESYKGEIRGV